MVDPSVFSSEPVPATTSRFYANYLTCLVKASIQEKQWCWYVKRVEDFIKTQNGCKIKSLTAMEVNRYLEVIGRQNRLSGWQFGQGIHAIRIPFCDQLAASRGTDQSQGKVSAWVLHPGNHGLSRDSLRWASH